MNFLRLSAAHGELGEHKVLCFLSAFSPSPFGCARAIRVAVGDEGWVLFKQKILIK